MTAPAPGDGQKALQDILVVDDEVDNLDLLKRTFRREYNVHTANSAQEALRLLENQEFAVIVSDQRMPEMTGVELLQRAREKYPYTIRILLTGYTDINALVDAINMGHVYRYVTKPWSREEIVMTVKRAVEHYETTKHNFRLLEELKVKNEQLENSYKELKRLDELKTRFMVISSHELRTPASIISGNLELLMSGAMGDFQKDQKEIIENAYKGTARLIDLIEDVLSVLRIDSHKLKLNISTFNMRELIDESIGALKIFINERKQTVVNNISAIELEADRNRMYQAIINLLSNAMKYSKDGATIEFKGQVENGAFHMICRDNGIGIPKGELEKIFEKFYQLGDADQHRTSKHKFMGGGSGLGLTIVRGTMEEHNGKIWAESDGPNTGTSIHLIIPMHHTPGGVSS